MLIHATNKFTLFRSQIIQFQSYYCCNYESSISSKTLGNSSVLEIITQLVEFRNSL